MGRIVIRRTQANRIRRNHRRINKPNTGNNIKKTQSKKINKTNAMEAG